MNSLITEYKWHDVLTNRSRSKLGALEAKSVYEHARPKESRLRLPSGGATDCRPPLNRLIDKFVTPAPDFFLRTHGDIPESAAQRE